MSKKNDLHTAVEQAANLLSEYADDVIILACNKSMRPAQISYKFYGDKYALLGHMHTAIVIPEAECSKAVEGYYLDEYDQDDEASM